MIETEHKKFELTTRAGVLGKFFGSDEYAGRNIAGLLAVVLVVAGLGYTFTERTFPAKDLWAVIGPLIGTILGFMFGRSDAKE